MNRTWAKMAGGAVVLATFCGVAEAQVQSAAPPTDVSRQGGSLSEKLNSTNGVIRPEGAIDPGMQKAPPPSGTTPVVPPPGSPGGASGVTPK